MDPMQQNIMNAFGLDQLPEEQQAELFKRIGAVLFQSITLRAIEQMSDEEQNDLDAYLGEHPNDPEALMAYLAEHVPDLDRITQDEIARFRASALELMQRPVA